MHQFYSFIKNSLLVPVYKRLNKILTNEELEKIFLENKILKNSGFQYSRTADEILVNSEKKSIHLRVNSSDFKVFKQILIDEEYKPLISAIRDNNIEIKSIVDAGANIGLFSIYFNNYFPSASIICIEPGAENFKMLKKNLSNIEQKVFLYNNALWSKNERLFISNNFRDGEDWSLSVSNKKAGLFTEVSSLTIEDIFKQINSENVDLLKIDIEGAEFELFENQIFIDYLDKVKVISIEVHKEVKSPQIIISNLREKKFILFEYSETLIGFNSTHLLKN